MKLYTRINKSFLSYDTSIFSREKLDTPKQAEKKLIYKNYLDNILLCDVIKLLSSSIKFSIFELLNVSEKYFEFFPNLISLLEFDSKNLFASKCLFDFREEKYKSMHSEKKKNIVKSGISEIKNILGTVFENVSGLTKDLAGTLFLGHSGERKKVSKNNDYFEQYNENFMYNNPIMRGIISQKNYLHSLVYKEDSAKVLIEKQIKMMVCDILLNFLDRRTNFLVSNFIAWYEELMKKYNFLEEINIKYEIDEDLTSLLPRIMKSGIDILDTKYQIKDESDLNLYNVMDYFGGKLQHLLGTLNLMQNETKQYKLKKFKLFTKEEEIPDLDVLVTGVKKEGFVSKTFLPSLLVSFYLNEDFELDKKLLQLITKCFNQRFEFAKALKDLEVLFDGKDIHIYQFIHNKMCSLRLILDKSEVFKYFLLICTDF